MCCFWVAFVHMGVCDTDNVSTCSVHTEPCSVNQSMRLLQVLLLSLTQLCIELVVCILSLGMSRRCHCLPQGRKAILSDWLYPGTCQRFSDFHSTCPNQVRGRGGEGCPPQLILGVTLLLVPADPVLQRTCTPHDQNGEAA